MNTRNFIAAGAALLLASATAAADSLPLESVNKANAVIDAAIQAYGGAALDDLKTITQEQEMTTWAVGQSRKPGPPWDQGSSHNFNAIDMGNQVFVNQTRGEGGGFVFEQGVIINGDNSWQLNQYSGTAAPMAEPDFNTQSGPFVRITPALLVQQLQARRQTSNWLGQVDLDGRAHDVITLVMEVGPALALYFDQQTHLLTRMERALPPFGQVGYAFLDYQDVDGIPFNQTFRLYLNGEDNLVIRMLNTQVNQPLDAWLQVPDSLERVAAVHPDEFGSQEIDEGVFLIGGNNAYAMFVEEHDYVIAIGGTQTVQAGIEELRKSIPDKPIRYGVLTHHHSDHVPGAAAYAEEGATIITFKENEDVVRKAAGDPDAKLQFVDDRLTLGEGDGVVELYNIGPTPHAENFLVAYLPKQGILFEADHFPMPLTGVIPPAVPATVAFAAALDRLNIHFQKLIDAHSPRIATPADLATALSRTPANSASAGM